MPGTELELRCCPGLGVEIGANLIGAILLGAIFARASIEGAELIKAATCYPSRSSYYCHKRSILRTSCPSKPPTGWQLQLIPLSHFLLALLNLATATLQGC